MRVPFFSQQLIWLLLVFVMDRAEASECNRGGGCDLAFGGYKVRSGDTLNALTQLYFSPITIPQIMAYRGGEGGNKDFILIGEILKIPFTCDCIDGKFLAHNFVYTASAGDTYERIASNYSSLVSVQWLQARNSYDVDNIPVGGNVNVTVNCTCGDASVSTTYGLFMTYPLINSGADPNQQLLATLSTTYNVSSLLLQQYNPAVNFSSSNNTSQQQQLVFIPVKDANGSYRPLQLSSNGMDFANNNS